MKMPARSVCDRFAAIAASDAHLCACGHKRIYHAAWRKCFYGPCGCKEFGLAKEEKSNGGKNNTSDC